MAKGNAADGIFSLKAMDPVFNSDWDKEQGQKREWRRNYRGEFGMLQKMLAKVCSFSPAQVQLRDKRDAIGVRNDYHA
jgi:hypothetical protein